MKLFYENERKNYKGCGKNVTLKRASQIYNCKKKKSEKKDRTKNKSEKFSMINPLFRKTNKNKKSK